MGTKTKTKSKRKSLSNWLKSSNLLKSRKNMGDSFIKAEKDGVRNRQSISLELNFVVVEPTLQNFFFFFFFFSRQKYWYSDHRSSSETFQSIDFGKIIERWVQLKSWQSRSIWIEIYRLYHLVWIDEIEFNVFTTCYFYSFFANRKNK